ncbi:SGNH/GDSL hydrolase family protein [Homoserinibacter sp. YIM 151385]|uniref:SGNH/GDSL hydrolase family protein n=1 Tax=Homoserinibacter sp. YIM 151385 TaxID=2985506 RepID=UPI0022F056A9|nr:SGNH/GDSL hydrolase family protein [Homoserinibacter sp. YIM 151385]WBU37376.1 SGNH/GDSL hydrolase family protein [Homoserinibacter sp. YIM 151385]
MDAPRFLSLSRVIAAAQWPVVIRQATELRAIVPRLPDAERPWRGEMPGPDPLRLLVLGDSTAAGVGVQTQEDGLPGALAAELAERLGRGVHWRAVGENGASSRALLDRFMEEALAEPADLVFLSAGANDALQMRSTRVFRRDVEELLDRLGEAWPHATILMSSLPAFVHFDLLPEPLATSLWRHTRALERAARRVVARDERRHMSPPAGVYTEGFFAEDLFHPSASGYRHWAEFAIDDAWDAGVGERLELAR